MKKAKAITNNIVESTYTKRMILKILFLLLIAIFSVYIYLIGSITFNILARKSIENNTKILVNEVSQIEVSYINKVNEINKTYALSLGFVENEPDFFVLRNPSSHVAIR